MGRTKLSGVTPEDRRTESSVEAEVTGVVTKRLDGIKNRDETAIRDKFSPASA